MVPGKQIRVKELLDNIRAGLSDAQIMAAYDITHEELVTLYEKLRKAGLLDQTDRGLIVTEKRRLPVEDLVQDVRSGVPRGELMKKYMLSARAAETLLKKLVARGFIGEEQMHLLLQQAVDPGSFYERRNVVRKDLIAPVPIRDRLDPRVQGTIRNISPLGIRVEGIPAEIGQHRCFEIMLDEVVTMKPLLFDAVCKWSTLDEGEASHQAGFEIMRVIDADPAYLEEVVESITILP